MAFPHRHLLYMADLSPKDITQVLDLSDTFLEISTRPIKKVPTLRGKTVVSLFYEASTRTRASFEIAAKRLSADFVSLSSAASSAMKGETLLDTARNLAAMRPDAIIIRHGAAGAPHFLARRLDCPIINAGDGAHEHPTQALLDALTIREHKGRLDGLTVAVVGDVLHSRVARSNVFALKCLGASIRLVGPPTLLPPELRAWGDTTSDLHEGVRDADVIMMLRLQLERQGKNFFPTVDEYSRYFCLTEGAVAQAKPDVIILHPGPMNRGVEIASDVADGPYSVIMNQVTNGIAVRMAVLYLLVNRPKVKADVEVESRLPQRAPRQLRRRAG